MKKKRKIKVSDECYFGEEYLEQLLCPECGFDYVHFEKPTILETDSYGGEGPCRGKEITIPCSCENAHQWEMKIAFHKGHSFIWATNIMDDPRYQRG